MRRFLLPTRGGDQVLFERQVCERGLRHQNGSVGKTTTILHHIFTPHHISTVHDNNTTAQTFAARLARSLCGAAERVEEKITLYFDSDILKNPACISDQNKEAKIRTNCLFSTALSQKTLRRVSTDRDA